MKSKSLLISFFSWLSCNRYLRKISPFFSDWYFGFIHGDYEKRAIVSSRAVGWYRSVFFWRFAPRKYTGGAVLNLLGLQMYRYFFYNFRYRMRWRRGDTARQLESCGLIIKRGFISEQTVTRLLSFYAENRDYCANHFRDFSELVILNSKGVVRDDQAYDQLVDHLLSECEISKLGVDLTGLTLVARPFISIIHYKSFVDQIEQLDGQDTPHSDVLYPSFKLFVYLNDVNEENGAFRYLLGSNRFTIDGAINSYFDSIKHYFKGGRRSLYPTEATAYDPEFKWMSAVGNAGDGIIFNVQGVHCRGDFVKDRYRERLVLLVDFRQVEVPVQRYAANV